MRPLMLFVALAAVFGVAGSAGGQDRMPPIPADKLTDAQKKAIEEFKAARSVDISGPFVAMLRSPEVMSRARAMGERARKAGLLFDRRRAVSSYEHVFLELTNGHRRTA